MNTLNKDGKMEGNVEFGAIVFIQVVVVVHLKLLIEWQSMNMFTLISYVASLIAVVFWCLLPSSFIIAYPLTVITEDQNFYWIFYRLLANPSVWLLFLVTSVASLIPDTCIKIFENFYYDWNLKNQNKLKHLNHLKKKRCLDDVPSSWNTQILKRTSIILFINSSIFYYYI